MVPVIEAMARKVTVPISIDTYKAAVAEQAISVGAAMVNDVWALQRDHDIATVAAEV